MRDQIETQTQSLAQRLGVHYRDVRKLDVEVSEDILTFEQIKEYNIVPLWSNNYRIEFGFTKQTQKSALEEVKQHIDEQHNIDFVLISKKGFEEVYQKFKHKLRPEVDPLKHLDMEMSQVKPDKILEFVVHKAVRAEASDIHIEAKKNKGGVVRFRIDGRLQDIGELPYGLHRKLVGGIKMRGDVNAQTGTNQTGHLNMMVPDKEGREHELNMRVEIVSSAYGDDVVLRLFSIHEKYLHLENLGLLDYHQQPIQDAIRYPEGLILLVGPTGSGKTTTLYATLNALDKEHNKIVTLEDPVEYELGGITQVPVDTSRGKTFADQFKITLREDPDVIMVGEIRSQDAAGAALQASMTGHLVLSTFHANSSSAALSRLSGMIQEKSMIASSVKFIMAQRLVRKLCDNCKRKQDVDERVRKIIQNVVDSLPDPAAQHLDSPQLYQAVGCEECLDVGYSGRTAIAEQLKISPGLEKMIMKEQAATSSIEEYAQKQDEMITMYGDGLVKALNGTTSLDELERALGPLEQLEK